MCSPGGHNCSQCRQTGTTPTSNKTKARSILTTVRSTRGGGAWDGGHSVAECTTLDRSVGSTTSAPCTNPARSPSRRILQAGRQTRISFRSHPVSSTVYRTTLMAIFTSTGGLGAKQSSDDRWNTKLWRCGTGVYEVHRAGCGNVCISKDFTTSRKIQGACSCPYVCARAVQAIMYC